MSSSVFPARNTRNILTNAEAISAWGATTGVTFTADDTAAPNGTVTADRVTYSGGGTAGNFRFYQSATSVAGAPYTCSIYLKSISGATSFLLSNGLATTPITLTASWQRFSITRIVAGTSVQVIIYSAVGDNSVFALHAWGGQVELGDLSTYNGALISDNSLTPYVIPSSVRKVPLYRTVIQGQDGGSEYRVRRAAERFRYEMSLDGLTATPLATLRTFFETHVGAWDRFYLEDPETLQLLYVRFDQDELDLQQDDVSGYWSTSLSFISVI